MKLRIGLDLDDTIFSFMIPYKERFGDPKDDYEITRNVERVLKKDKEWWLSQPLINRPDFRVELYCTKRVHNKEWTRKQLAMHNLPKAPIYQMYTQSRNKADLIKGRVDVFVDDSLSNFIAMNKVGLPCLLLDSPYNQKWGPVGRIYTLEKEEIEEVYWLFKDTLFPHFRELL